MEKFIFSREEYSKFLTILEALSKNCSDCQIINGKIRIRSNNKAILYDIQLPNEFENFNLSITALDNFLSLIKIFLPETENDHVEIEINERTFKIKDKYTELDIDIPTVLQNKYISDEELNKINFFDKTELYNTTLPETIINRINSIRKSFGVTVLNLDVKDSKLSLEVRSESKTKLAKFNLDNSDCKIPDGSYLLPYLVLDYPFEEVKLSIHQLKNGTLIVICEDESAKTISGIIPAG